MSPVDYVWQKMILSRPYGEANRRLDKNCQRQSLTWRIFPIISRNFSTVSRQNMSFGFRQALDVTWFPGLHEFYWMRFCFSETWARFRASGLDFESREALAAWITTHAAMLLVQPARCASRIGTHVRWGCCCFVKAMACSFLCIIVFQIIFANVHDFCKCWNDWVITPFFVNLGRSVTETGVCWKWSSSFSSHGRESVFSPRSKSSRSALHHRGFVNVIVLYRSVKVVAKSPSWI